MQMTAIEMSSAYVHWLLDGQVPS